MLQDQLVKKIMDPEIGETLSIQADLVLDKAIVIVCQIGSAMKHAEPLVSKHQTVVV